MTKTRRRIEINIGTADADISAWLETINALGQSRVKWMEALIVAFKTGSDIDTGHGDTRYKNSHNKQYATYTTRPYIAQLMDGLITEGYSISDILKQMIRSHQSANVPDIQSAVNVLCLAPEYARKGSRLKSQNNDVIVTHQQMEVQDEPHSGSGTHPLLTYIEGI